MHYLEAAASNPIHVLPCSVAMGTTTQLMICGELSISMGLLGAVSQFQINDSVNLSASSLSTKQDQYY